MKNRNHKTPEDPGPCALLLMAAKTGCGELIRKTLQKHSKLGGIRQNGLTLLHLAAKHERPEAIRALLDAGCDPNAPDSAGLTPIMLAIQSRKILSQMALAHASDPSRKTPGGDPLALWAASVGSPAAGALLAHYERAAIRLPPCPRPGARSKAL